MTQAEKETVIGKVEKFMRDISKLIPHGCDISIRREADNFMSISIMKWDDLEENYEKAKRLNVMDVSCFNGKWGSDQAEDMNRYLKKEGLLLEENENTPAFAEVG